MAPAPVYREPKGEFPPGSYRMSWNTQEDELTLKSGGRYSWKTWSGLYRYDRKTRTFHFEDLPPHLNTPRFWRFAVDEKGWGFAEGFYGRATIRIWRADP